MSIRPRAVVILAALCLALAAPFCTEKINTFRAEFRAEKINTILQPRQVLLSSRFAQCSVLTDLSTGNAFPQPGAPSRRPAAKRTYGTYPKHAEAVSTTQIVEQP
jgi:hypothetical protein